VVVKQVISAAILIRSYAYKWHANWLNFKLYERIKLAPDNVLVLVFDKLIKAGYQTFILRDFCLVREGLDFSVI
jgi:hypothetical protein